MSNGVLDASALLAVLFQEPGAERVTEAMESGALVSSVNLSEVVAKLTESAGGADSIRNLMGSLKFDVIDFDAGLAWQAGLLRSATRRYGLSLGDRACLALGAGLGLPVLTGDSAWAELDIGVEVRLIR